MVDVHFASYAFVWIYMKYTTIHTVEIAMIVTSDQCQVTNKK